MDFLVEFFVDLFGGINKELIVFIISLMPILELRGGLLAASLLDIEFTRAAVICVVGNVLPIPFVLLFLRYVLTLFEKWNVTKKIVNWLEKKVEEKREQIDKYGYLGLIIFVGIPLIKEEIENQVYREECRRRGWDTYWSTDGLRYTSTNQKVYK